MSAEAQELLGRLVALVGLPLALWLCWLIAKKVKGISIDSKEGRQQHHLFTTTRIFFVVAGVTLIGWGALSLGARPTDYILICFGIGAALLFYPLVSNLLRLGLLWGTLGTAAQIVLVVVAAAIVVLSVEASRGVSVPSVESLSGYVSLLTWQMLALVAGIVFFPQVYRILGGVKEFDIFGVKGRLNLQEAEQVQEEAEDEVQQAVAKEGAVEALQEAVDEQADNARERYKTAMKVWSAVAYIIRDLAVQNGSNLSAANQTSEQIPELLKKGVLTASQAKRAEELLGIRNGWRANASRPVDQREFASFKHRSKLLGTQLSRLLRSTQAVAAVAADGAAK